MSQDEQIKKLTIQELLNQDNYIIPIYQRNYAWGDSEIEALLTDLIKAYERKTHNYYIGSLVVYRRDDSQFEVIDGQQRLTTFTLIKHFLQNEIKILGNLKEIQLFNKRNISFEYRVESDKALDNLQQPESLPWNFKDAMQFIKRHWNTLVTDEKSAEIIGFILKKVQIIRTEVPPETDLNHYFEIMNTRGEQLEKHEVLKARFMSRLQELSQQTTDKTEIPSFQLSFANIWDACSDMNRYVVMGFESDTRKKIFGDDWLQIPSENFDELTHYFKTNKSDSDIFNNQNPLTIANILANKTAVQVRKDNQEKSERFNSVIDFPNFLLHVLRIYHEHIKVDLNGAREVNLDEKNLLDSFKVDTFGFEDIKSFAALLLQCRYLFDVHVIKSDTSKGDDDHWSFHPQANRVSRYQYNNSFSDTDGQRKIVMLLSMFHVSHPARIYKNWLYAVLRWLYQHKMNITANEYVSFLENLSDRYYFCNYGKGIDFFEFITQENSDMQLSSYENNRLLNFLNLGTSVPNFIFNRLDYLLWKSEANPKKYQDFRFTFRSSVEHFYPQNPTNGERLSDEILHSLGNLCLISSSMNSKFSNNMPEAKVANFGKDQNLSLKLSLMMEKAKNWNEYTINQHCKEMIELLNSKSIRSS